MATLHYTAGNNINAQGTYAPAAAGFNLADVSSVSELNALPAGVQGMVYLDQGSGVTQSFIDAVKAYIGNPKVYGFYLKDEPDPTGQYNTLVTAANLKAESDYIHANVPGAKTFITMMNMGSSENPTYANTYNPTSTHIDLFGIDPYPVRSDMSTVDYSMIDKAVAAAESAGISADHIVPVFQTFGGGNWADDSGGHYVMPTAAQEQTMLAHWAAAVPHPAFDYAYAWGSQNGDTALESSSALQSVFLQHNTGTSTTLPAGGTGGGSTSSSGGSTTPVTGSSGGTTTGSSGGTGSAAGGGTTTGGTTTGSSSGSSSGGSTSTTDSGQHHHHHHHGLDFSQLATTATTASPAIVPTSTTSTPTVGGSGATDAASNHTDAATHLTDLISHHTDHHAWHF
ncbi:calcium-binding protein [Bradyrhizobium sp. LB11.1]|uniref:calcium-binding protein n=1 Tax=Bradyrhizobium sp. LB11.1 TaxID=3156326 RepID=UPI0033944605